ncbi:MAG: hypothetical protein FWC66_05550 [Oscillospiraceae bacterium]|nr:hypothetical protein [Oscillospiraceae bacterium]
MIKIWGGSGKRTIKNTSSHEKAKQTINKTSQNEVFERKDYSRLSEDKRQQTTPSVTTTPRSRLSESKRQQTTTSVTTTPRSRPPEDKGQKVLDFETMMQMYNEQQRALAVGDDIGVGTYSKKQKNLKYLML